MANIRKFLDLAAAHLTPRDADYLEESCVRGAANTSTVSSRMEHGFFVYASEEPGDDVPGNIKRAMAKARELGCDYLLFDQDAEPCKGLPVFDSETGQEATWEELQAA